MDALHVIFRSCTRVGNLNAHRFGNTRPFTDSKRELVLVCLNSLLDSLGERGVVHVIDDHSPEDDVIAIKKLLANYGAQHTFVSLEKTGNGYSYDAALEFAREKKFELMYFCEDDYLHLPHAIESMLDFYNNKKAIIFPVDYFDRYTEPYQSHVFLGTYNYWRSVKHTTFTFIIDKRILETYWNVYKELAKRNMDSVGSGAEDNTINKIYEKELCVSPLPSLAAHLGPIPPLPPFVSWKSVFEKNKADALRRIQNSNIEHDTKVGALINKETEDPLLTSIVNRISFRFMDQFTPGTMNSMIDPQSNLRGLDLANTQIEDTNNPLMLIDFLRTPRMSTIAIAYIINKLVKNMPVDHIYLNIGVWCGWSFFSGMIGNEEKVCVGVDNFSETGGIVPPESSKKIFEHQYKIFKTSRSDFYEMDYMDYFKEVHKNKIGVYFYDGNHSYENQLKALQIADNFLAQGAYIIVDDTNDNDPHKASVDFVSRNSENYKIVLDKKTAYNSHPTFWNGLLILKKIKK